VKHAGAATVHRLSLLLDRIRASGTLTEKKPGVFYRKSRAFLHFHEHGSDVFADVRLDGNDFTRLPCSTPQDQQALLERIRQCLEDR
jgi:hypothetical protein